MLYIHIGYPKTATTWLQRHVFSQHPEITYWTSLENMKWIRQLPRLHDFDFHPDTYREEILSSIADNNKIIVVSLESLVGDPFAGGYNSRINADRLHSLFPHAKIVITIRNQLTIIESLYKQYIHEGGSCSLDRFLRLEPYRLHFSMNFLLYDRVIEYYFKLFKESSVAVFLYEALKDNPQDFLVDLFSFLGVNPKESTVDLGVRSNQGMSLLSLYIARFANRFLYSHRNPGPVIPSRLTTARKIRHILQGRLDPLMLSRISPKKNLIDEGLKNELIKYYKHSNSKLIATLGLPLQKYGYPVESELV